MQQICVRRGTCLASSKGNAVSQLHVSGVAVVEQGGGRIYRYGGLEIDLRRRELRVHGKPAPIGARAFDIIEVLVEAAGELVSNLQGAGR